MFPPMSPLSERVRVDLENKEFEREAAFRAQMGNGIHLFSRIRGWFGNLRWRVPAATPNRAEVFSERRVTSRSSES